MPHVKVTKKGGGLLRISIFLLLAIILGTLLCNSQEVPDSNAPPAWLKSWQPPVVPVNYYSPGNLHKVLMEEGDTEQGAVLMTISSQYIYQYTRRKLHLVSNDEIAGLSPDQRSKLRFRDDWNLIRLRGRYFDTSIPDDPQGSSDASAASEHLRATSKIPAQLIKVPTKKNQLHLVQFVGPVQDEWINKLKSIDNLEIVSYIPENAYLIWTDQEGIEAIDKLVKLQPYLQWHGAYHPAYKIHPSIDLNVDEEIIVTIQVFNSEKATEAITQITGKALAVTREKYEVDNFINIRVKFKVNQLQSIAHYEAVVNIEPWWEPVLFGERQDQIVAGNINAAGTGPNGPGYLAWLNGLGFTTNFDFVVDLTDGGIDRGETTSANIHPDFRDAAGNSRIVYSRRIVGTNSFTTNDEDQGGHGTIDASIIGGFNDTPATDPDFDYFADADGYRFGLGVAPYTLLGSSRIFPWPTPDPDFTTLMDLAYQDGARISSNSFGSSCWGGCCGAGILSEYTVESQEYDELVRDARSGEDGNQEMVIVFAAGNEGDCPDEQLGNIGATAKNTIVVGASENNNQAGTDGCGVTNADADNIEDIAHFSSTGPTQDGRTKPDIMAPGTHIFGAASQDPGFEGYSVCGSATNDGVAPPDDAYFPADPDVTDTREQDLYTWCSGTSQACPAVSGGSALIRQWFLNNGSPAPSPAMTKAFLMSSATHMTGNGANDDLYSNNQGMGRMNLGMAFDNTPRLLFDQMKTCYRNGAADASEIFETTGSVSDNTLPFRVTLAWTDAPGNPVTGIISNNDLDLEVEIGGNFYRGNDFTLGNSNIGAVADPTDELNNVESVFIPAGVTGNFTVRVRPADINADGVPNNSDFTDQDFALVVYNAEFPDRNPVDIILVLDRSGSMNSTAPGGTEDKIVLLKDAVEMFVRSWLPFSIPEDRLGVVFFNDGIEKFPNTNPVLLPFQSNADAIIDYVRGRNAQNCTALGGGIMTALNGFDLLPNRQRHIVVFTNGMQNCSPMVEQVGTAHQILDDPSPSCCNSGVPGQPGIDLGDYMIKGIHTIGTGTFGATWLDLIASISSETGGTSHVTNSPDEDLQDYFLETLVTTLRVDPVEKVKTYKGSIAKTEGIKRLEYSLNSSIRKASFILSWNGERKSESLVFTLRTPNGDVVPDNKISFHKGDFYTIGTVDFPLNINGSEVDKSGIWELSFSPNFASNQLKYTSHLIIDDADIRYDFGVPGTKYAVGESIPLTFWAQHKSRTLADFNHVEIKVDIMHPQVGFGTVLSKNSVSRDRIDNLTGAVLSNDAFVTDAGKKEYLLLQDNAIRNELTQITETLSLYDDGKPENGDAKANDGVFSTLFSGTTKPGYYTLRLKMTGVEEGLGTIYREEAKTIAVGMKEFDMDKSKFSYRPVKPTSGEKAYSVKATLIDSYKNFLGPGHEVYAAVVLPDEITDRVTRRVLLDDKLDGSYSGIINLSAAEVNDNAQLVLEVDNDRVSYLNEDLSPKRFILSVHAGGIIPTGNFANDYDPGSCIIFDAGYQLNKTLELVAYVGINSFTSKNTGADDLRVINISPNLKYRRAFSLTSNKFYYYLQAGPGVYVPDTGNTEVGFNIGAGLGYRLSSSLRLEMGTDYHKTFNEIQYSGNHMGILFNF